MNSGAFMWEIPIDVCAFTFKKIWQKVEKCWLLLTQDSVEMVYCTFLLALCTKKKPSKCSKREVTIMSTIKVPGEEILNENNVWSRRERNQEEEGKGGGAGKM
jgi:hypothetical protein